MTTHTCLHEVDFNQIANDIKSIKLSQERLEDSFGRIDKTVFGNGQEGHKTKLARQEDAIKRVWWAMGTLVTIFGGGSFGIAWWILKEHLK